jgi:iron complex transport system ATP-binding protein
VAYQPQSVEPAWSLSVRSVVALGRLPWGDEDAGMIDEAMREAGVAALADRPVDRLSGGEQARVWLARVLAGTPKIWLADEPIASLDLKYQRRVLERLRGFADAGGAVMLAIHDLPLAVRHCDRFCLLDSGGRAVIGQAEQVLTSERLSRVFEVPVRVDLAARPPLIQAV